MDDAEKDLGRSGRDDPVKFLDISATG